MLIHPTVERLRALGLAAMADAFMELQNAPDAGELSREATCIRVGGEDRRDPRAGPLGGLTA
jgi:hypothetical protein